jgi:hypothetical protein
MGQELEQSEWVEKAAESQGNGIYLLDPYKHLEVVKGR